MVVPVLNTGMETIIFSFGGGGILGVMAGMAFKRVVKFGAIIVGLFVLGLAFLSYRGWITANWPAIQSQTQSFAYNASAQVLHMVNDTTSRFVMHSLVHVEVTPIAAGGFFWGLKH